jgi:RNA 2',3'-cyclic 3'-phosphodiesterase
VGKRLFIAVDIDESTRGQVARVAADLRLAVEKQTTASWVRPDRMHLTLLFFGSVDAVLEERIRGALAQPVRESPFDLTFRGLGFFPERGSPRVLWLGIGDGLPELRRIQKILEHTSAAPPERVGPLDVARGRPFTPHLTLARFRDRVPRAKIVKIADIPASAGPSRIDRVTLYESRLSPAGPTYVPLAEALLSP